MDLVVAPEEGSVVVTVEPQEFIPFEVIENPAFAVPEDLTYGLDGPFRFLLQIAREIDEKRQLAADKQLEAAKTVLKNYRRFANRQIGLAQFMMTVSLRNLKGRKIDSSESRMIFFLDKQPGYMMIRLPDKKTWRVDLNALKKQEAYLNFLRKVVIPDGSVRLKRPSGDAFLVDLHFSAPFVNEGMISRFGLEKSKRPYMVLSSLSRYDQEEQLGVTFCYEKGGDMAQVPSGHLRFLRDTMRDYSGALAKTVRGENAMAELEALVTKMPAELNAIEMLVEAYLNNGMEDKAFTMLTRCEPLVLKSPRLEEHLINIRERRALAHKKMLDQRKHFKKEKNIELEILTPSKWDFIGGETELVFQVHNNTAPLLQAELYANGKPVGVLIGKPYRFAFSAVDLDRSVDLTLKTWFKNRTWQEIKLPVRTIALSAQEKIQRISLRTVATRGSRFLTDLTTGDFQVFEHDAPREVVAFKRDTAPLRIAILLDISGSMLGEKLHRCQYAVNAFLSALDKRDTAAVYGFNSKVLKFTGFTNDFDNMRDLLFTMQPQLATSLNDALLVARNDLMQEEGTQVIIVLSDGADSASKVSNDELFQALGNSNVVVYSVIMGDDGIIDRRGADFLHQVSKVTGSVTTELNEIENLDEAFQRIYQELKSFYFVDFYSNQKQFDVANVEIRIGDGKTRFRRHLSLEDIKHGQGTLRVGGSE
ncbi:MAG: VWA domain-containing protein [Acidobacteriota bacterium]|nr:VWA domain-containing protein [Acidobacteriota bacterium]